MTIRFPTPFTTLRLHVGSQVPENDKCILNRVCKKLLRSQYGSSYDLLRSTVARRTSVSLNVYNSREKPM